MAEPTLESLALTPTRFTTRKIVGHEITGRTSDFDGCELDFGYDSETRPTLRRTAR